MKKKTVSGVIKDLQRILIDEKAIEKRIREMAAEISAECTGKVVTVVALMDGSLFFVADLLRRIDLPIKLVTLCASSYHGTKSTGKLTVNWPANISFKDETVLLLDDILDTGLTLSEIRAHIESHQPAWLRCGVLLSKRRERAREVTSEYIGFEIEDEFVVGYGMDYNGRFRNLPCIGVLQLDSAD